MTKETPAVPIGRTETVHIDSVIPYWRNPRNLNQEAVEAVRQSIERYGYAQPIVVDSSYTIIIGHTRYTAMRKLEVTELPVMVVDHLSKAEVKQLRVIDNKSGEFAFWDFNKLMDEITDKDSEFLRHMFSEVIGHEEESDEEAAANDFSQPAIEWESVDPTVEFVCPSCYHEWETEVTRENIMSGVIKSKEVQS